MDTTIGEWQRICELGEGGFGVVSLWKNYTSNETIGKIEFLTDIYNHTAFPCSNKTV